MEVTLRTIRPDDAARLIDFHRHLSTRSIYRRFFSVHPVLSAREVERFTCVDQIDRLALIAEDGDRLVAVGRYDRSPGTAEAEVAFVVADDCQHQGIATTLLVALAEAAREHGIASFVALVLPENHQMLNVFRHSGFPMGRTVEDGVVTVRLALTEGDAPVELGATSGAGGQGERSTEGLGSLRHVS
ncbi:MAG TPA: GNAT family N-acetyltransferase [Acidimicrobiales bacterium]